MVAAILSRVWPASVICLPILCSVFTINHETCVSDKVTDTYAGRAAASQHVSCYSSTSVTCQWPSSANALRQQQIHHRLIHFDRLRTFAVTLNVYTTRLHNCALNVCLRPNGVDNVDNGVFIRALSDVAENLRRLRVLKVGLSSRPWAYWHRFGCCLWSGLSGSKYRVTRNPTETSLKLEFSCVAEVCSMGARRQVHPLDSE